MDVLILKMARATAIDGTRIDQAHNIASTTTVSESKVLKARFALGADDGAYLRSNVMPLQSVDDECDSIKLANEMDYDANFTTRIGAYEAAVNSMQASKAEYERQMEVVIEMSLYLLSIEEVADAVIATVLLRKTEFETTGAVDTARRYAVAALTAHEINAGSPQIVKIATDRLRTDNYHGLSILLYVLENNILQTVTGNVRQQLTKTVIRQMEAFQMCHDQVTTAKEVNQLVKRTVEREPIPKYRQDKPAASLNHAGGYEIVTGEVLRRPAAGVGAGGILESNVFADQGPIWGIISRPAPVETIQQYLLRIASDYSPEILAALVALTMLIVTTAMINSSRRQSRAQAQQRVAALQYSRRRALPAPADQKDVAVEEVVEEEFDVVVENYDPDTDADLPEAERVMHRMNVIEDGDDSGDKSGQGGNDGGGGGEGGGGEGGDEGGDVVQGVKAKKRLANFFNRGQRRDTEVDRMRKKAKAPQRMAGLVQRASNAKGAAGRQPRTTLSAAEEKSLTTSTVNPGSAQGNAIGNETAQMAGLFASLVILAKAVQSAGLSFASGLLSATQTVTALASDDPSFTGELASDTGGESVAEATLVAVQNQVQTALDNTPVEILQVVLALLQNRAPPTTGNRVGDGGAGGGGGPPGGDGGSSGGGGGSPSPFGAEDEDASIQGFCRRAGAINQRMTDALVAAFEQMNGLDAPEYRIMVGNVADRVRMPSVSALFERKSYMDDQVENNGDAMLSYALARGLCAEPPPHALIPVTATRNRYTVASRAFPLQAVELLQAETAPPQIESRTGLRDELVVDFAKWTPTPENVEYQEASRATKWSPVVQTKAYSSQGKVVSEAQASDLENENVEEIDKWDVDKSESAKAVASCVVLEQLVDYYKFRASQSLRERDRRVSFMQHAAVAKLMQLRHMRTVFQDVNNLDALAEAEPLLETEADEPFQCHFATRPVVRCPDSSVAFAADAGLSVFRDGTFDTELPSRIPAPEHAFGALRDGVRRPYLRDTLSRYLRKYFSQTRRRSSPPDPSVESFPMYVAPPVTGFPVGGALQTTQTKAPRRVINKKFFPPDAFGSSLESVANACRTALVRLDQLWDLNARIRATQEAIDNDRLLAQKDAEFEDSANQAARKRRKAVYDDATREACLSGDRLYAFVRLLSGNIGEAVDAVCQIDEGQLVRQQQESRTARSRASERATQEHMQLVRSVFAEVIKESGLTLGIDQPGGGGSSGGGSSGGGGLKVVSNTLRKQLAELTQKGARGEGFFSNAVQLERLLAQGTGEMTLTELFAKLQEAGVALQKAALGAAQPAAGPSTSLEFLSAPRNSLLVRYKPEAHAAIRRAFDVFQQEMHRHGAHHRQISAFELIEGRDEELCSEFAALCGHMLVHSRMFSSSTAIYISAWPASANVTMLRISLQKLVDVACRYLEDFFNAPPFLAPEGRHAYFAHQPTKRRVGMTAEVSLGVIMARRGNPWALSLY